MFYSRLTIRIIVLLLVLLQVLESSAQTQIAFGETKENLPMAPAQNTVFTFSATEGQIVSIQMTETSGDFNPTFDLLSPAGAVLRTVNDSSSARLAPYRLTATGNYLVVCRDMTGDFGGAYNLTLINCVGENPVENANDRGTLVSGQTKAPTMLASDMDVFSFSGSAGDLVTIQITETAGDFNPTFDLLSAAGSILRNVTHNSSARLALYSLPASGTYYVLCRDQTGNFGGSYNLSFTLLRLADSDNDTLDDAWERQYFTDLRYGPEDDPDTDRLKNSDEASEKTNPNKADTDDDTYRDGAEVALGSDPLDAKSQPFSGLQIVVRTVDLEFLAVEGFDYQLQASEDHQTWDNLGAPIKGDNALFRTNIDVRGSHYRWFVAPRKAAP